jgi:arylsulfatase A-like enzyme
MTSDHGEGLGEGDAELGGLWNHDDVREPQVRVPLVLRPPGARPAGRRVPEPASGVDVAPTLRALAGLEPGASAEGRDLLREPPPGERERWVDDRDHLSPAEHRCALYRGAFKLVRTGVGPQARYELFDLAADPAGVLDVQQRHAELFAELMARMEARWPAGAVAPVPEGGWNPGAALEALGYAGE